MSSSSLLVGAVNTLVADSVKPRQYKVNSTRLVVDTDPALQYYSDTCGVFQETSGGAAARVLLTTAAPAVYAASGDAVILITPLDADGWTHPTYVTAAVAGTSITLDTSAGDGTWFWEIRRVA